MLLSDLKPNPENPRTITDDKLKMLEKSMKEFGDLSGIVFNKRTGRLVGGHQRSKNIATTNEIHITETYEKSDGSKEDAGYIEANGERFRVRLVDWPEIKEKAANLSANEAWGDWNEKIRDEWYLELDHHNFDFEAIGKTRDEIGDILTRNAFTEGNCDADATPEVRQTSIRLGDFFQLGSHKLLCGDSTDATQVERLMSGEKAVMWSSDPPYGINHVETSQEKGQSVGYEKILNDELQDKELQDFIFKCIEASKPHLKENFAFYMWHAMKMQGYFAAAAAAADILFHRQIIWVKPQFVFGRGHYHWRHELCLMGWLKGNEPPFYGERNQSTIWEIERENDKIHPTQKPVAIWEKPILNHVLPGEVVYEPFSGSGSQIMACEKTKRKCYAMELDPVYVQVAIDRWEKFTGRKAEKLG